MSCHNTVVSWQLIAIAGKKTPYNLLAANAYRSAHQGPRRSCLKQHSEAAKECSQGQSSSSSSQHQQSADRPRETTQKMVWLLMM
jgi:hypothetical protein